MKQTVASYLFNTCLQCKLIEQVFGAVVQASIITNEAISACRFLKMKGSYIRGFIVFGAIVLVSIIMNEAISACRFLKVDCTPFDPIAFLSTTLIANKHPYSLPKEDRH